MINAILNHRSIRNYKDVPVPDDILNKILLAATRASTTGNMQVYSIIVTKDYEIRKQLWEAHFKQDMVLKAPVILTFCADFNRFIKWCEYREADPGYDNFLSFYTASIDALIAAQNAAVAAEHFDLGICYLGTTTYMAEKIIEILDLPKFVVPATSLVLGYPDDNPGLTPRLPMNSVVHEEKYHQFDEEDINTIYAERENSAETKELLKINNKKELAQIFTDNRYTRKDNVQFSKSFLEIIKKQGFMNHE